MYCPDSVLLNNYLQFRITTHNPEYGNLSDADTAPSYKIFDDQDTLVGSGTLTKIGSETGCYRGSHLCDDQTFTDGDEYTICIKATVDSVTGGIARVFKAHAESVMAIGTPITIRGFDALSGRTVQIAGRYL